MHSLRQKLIAFLQQLPSFLRGKDESWLSVAERFAIIIALVWAILTFLIQQEHTEVQASIQMNAYITDHEFMQALNNILYKEYNFRCQKKLNLSDIKRKEALEFFNLMEADDNISLDESFLVVISHLDSLARCVYSNTCSESYSSNMFPYPVVQAIDYMMPYLKHYNSEGLTWTLGKYSYEFLKNQPKPTVEDRWAPASYELLCGPEPTPASRQQSGQQLRRPGHDLGDDRAAP